MDLFLLNEGSQVQPTFGKLAVFAGIGISAIYFIYKIFGNLDSDQDDEQIVEQAQKPAGIYNQGNTCFVNSLLQALASLSLFEQNLQQTVRNFRSHSKNEELITELLHVTRKINSNSQSIDVVHFLSLISQIKKDLINLEQQDAHELFAAIIGCFDETLIKQKRMDLSASVRSQDEQQIQNYLIGYTKSSIICSRCKTETAVKIHPFSDLSLQIRAPHIVDVKSALHEYERQQIIQSWTCTNCSIQTHITKLKTSMKKLTGPNKNKLSFIGEAISQYLQNQNHVESDISEVNDNLASYVMTYKQQYKEMQQDPERDSIFVELEGQQSTIIKKTTITKYPKIFVIHLKQLVINPLTGYPELLRKYISFDQTLSIKRKNGEKNYKLTSLLTHIGNQSMGHYYTFRRLNPHSQKWYVISDSYSKHCEWANVRQSRAYMLFYEQE